MRAHYLWSHLRDFSKFLWDKLVMPNCAFLEAVFTSLYLISSYFPIVAWHHRMKAAEILSMDSLLENYRSKENGLQEVETSLLPESKLWPQWTSSPSHTSWWQGLRLGYEDKAAPGAAAPTGHDIKLNRLNPYESFPTQDIFCDIQYIISDSQVIIIMKNLDSKYSFLNFNVGA